MRLIDADALKDSFYKAMYDCISMDMDRSARILNACINRIKEAPTIEPKRGEWIEISKEVISIPIKWSEADKRKPIYKVKFRCSECGFQKSFIDWHTAQYNYCPNCGCAMTKE